MQRWIDKALCIEQFVRVLKSRSDIDCRPLSQIIGADLGFGPPSGTPRLILSAGLLSISGSAFVEGGAVVEDLAFSAGNDDQPPASHHSAIKFTPQGQRVYSGGKSSHPITAFQTRLRWLQI
jgi:hypothetical protein